MYSILTLKTPGGILVDVFGSTGAMASKKYVCSPGGRTKPPEFELPNLPRRLLLSSGSFTPSNLRAEYFIFPRIPTDLGEVTPTVVIECLLMYGSRFIAAEFVELMIAGVTPDMWQKKVVAAPVPEGSHV